MRGEVVYLYAFDVANEIQTTKIQEILAQTPVPFEIRADHTIPKDIPLYKPLVIEPTQGTVGWNGHPVRVFVRVYDVGVVSIVMRVPFTVGDLSELLPYHRPTLDTGATFDVAARELCAKVTESLRDVMVQSAPPSEPEPYTVFCLTEIDDVENVGQWVEKQRNDIARLLTETAQGELSAAQIHEVLRLRREFAVRDAVVIDWDAALVVDLTGYVDDVVYVIELANLQLEEYKMLDERLDRQLDRAYDDVKHRRPLGLLGAYTRILRSLRLLRVDVTKLSDEVTHISKFFGDWHLARVYRDAAERFYLDHWRRSVDDRLGQLDSLYSVVHSDISNQRMFWLEVLIVVFFAIDIGMLIWGHR